ncbi:MAG: MFS transporter [Clostridiales bacterium]|jgi:Na+/melibiose symporter-like transporter|nr:MFS transporter [Clostridiales bacterium]
MKMNQLKDKLSILKSHWTTPPPNYQVSYKEFLSFSLGSGGFSFISVLVVWTTLAMNIPLMVSYFHVSTGLIFFLTMTASLIGLIRAPILSMIIDNSRSLKGKFKPFLLVGVLGAGICFCLIPYIPSEWVETLLFSISVPELPIFGVDASTISISLGVLVMFLLLQIGSFFSTLLTQSLGGIEQTISTVAQERANISSFKNIIGKIPESVINIVMPLIAGAFFASGTASGMNNIMLYRIFFPICAIGGVIFVLFAYRGTKERTVVDKQYVNKVKFSDGVKELSKNKYFWIITVFSIFIGIRAHSNIYLWICTYAIGGQAGDTALAICNAVLNMAFLPGLILAPMLIKKFGKRKLIVVANIFCVGTILLQLFVLKNPYIILVLIFFQNLLKGAEFITAIMVSDVLDYQQWKTGRRLEGFWQNYHGFILTAAGLFTGILVPLFLSFAGIGFGVGIDTALQDSRLMSGAFRNITLLALLGSIVSMIPMFFYDLTEKKHANYIRALKLRAAVKNYQGNNLAEEDIVNVKKILEYYKETQDGFIKDEIDKHACLNDIAAQGSAG